VPPSACPTLHEKYPDAKKFGYHDGGKHAYDPAQDERLVLIGTASFTNDVAHAVGAFLEACKCDAEMRARVEGRLPQVLATFPIPSKWVALRQSGQSAQG
jgi:hypothetical protein